MNSILPALLFLVPFVAALLCVFVGRLSRGLVWWWTILTMAITAGLAVLGGIAVHSEGPIRVHMGGWAPPLGIEWALDFWGVLGVCMVAVVSLFTLAGTRESVRLELPGREISFYTCALLLVSGLMGMVLTADLFNLFVHMEITALSAYALVAAGGRGSARVAFNYLIMGSVGATLYLLGVGFLYSATGSLNMVDVGLRLAAGDQTLVMFGLSLIAVGLGVKMGLFPLHGWMPGAYSRTSTSSAALMTPIVTKVAAFVLIRILIHVFGLNVLPGVGTMLVILCWAGAAAMIFGGLLALVQSDFRRLLVYSSISQVGLVAIGVGLGNFDGVAGGLLHLVNDALMKGVLFLAAGLALVRFGVARVDDLGRLRGRAPWTAAAIAIAGLSLVGVPPLCGFFGKWYVLAGALDGRRWGLASAIVAGSVITAIYVFRFLEQLFFRAPSSQEERFEGPGLLVVACLALALGVIFFGLGSGHMVEWFIAPQLGLE
ncbi:hydrogenase 4 subunit B [bacterium]|nr:hydrogenase 4 subunit B [bacterium]